MNKNGETWEDWRRHVLIEIDRLHRSVESVKKDLAEVRTDIGTLRVKASIWGALAGMITTIGIILIKIIK